MKEYKNAVTQNVPCTISVKLLLAYYPHTKM